MTRNLLMLLQFLIVANISKNALRKKEKEDFMKGVVDSPDTFPLSSMKQEIKYKFELCVAITPIQHKNFISRIHL